MITNLSAMYSVLIDALNQPIEQRNFFDINWDCHIGVCLVLYGKRAYAFTLIAPTTCDIFPAVNVLSDEEHISCFRISALKPSRSGVVIFMCNFHHHSDIDEAATEIGANRLCLSHTRDMDMMDVTGIAPVPRDMINQYQGN